MMISIVVVVVPPLSTTVPESAIWLDEDIQTAQRSAACALQLLFILRPTLSRLAQTCLES